MARKRFIWQVFPAFLLTTSLALVLISFYVIRMVEDFELGQKRAELAARAALVIAAIEQAPLRDDPARLQTLCTRLGRETDSRITVIEADGQVIADSAEDPEKMDNHANRPEVMAALQGESGDAIRSSFTVDKQMMYVALAEKYGPRKRVIRVAMALDALNATLNDIYVRLAAMVVAIALLSAVLSWLVACRVVRPLEELKAGAAQFARGNFNHLLPVPNSEEVGQLAEALNEMARQCAFRFQAMEQQRNEQDAVFSSMMEGVLAVDSELRIISMNEAASTLLNVNPDAAKGRPILEVVRNMPLRDFARRALQGESAVEVELSVGQRVPLLVKAQGTVLRNGSGKAMGAVVVLNDITRLRQLEEVRQDFVANVSHELKTPITSIKGFVETLLDEPEPSPENTRRFLQIIEKQANRLDAIIEDLLSLSRLEQSKGSVSLQIVHAPVLPVIEAAVELCQHQAEARGIHIRVECPEGLAAPVNPPLLEQGLVNLISNAVKYSDEGQSVRVHVYEDGGLLIIDIVDQGTGIHANELDRIFERFYRIDKARSRELGGTGLGLSIVKHIAQAHGGRVTVSSTPGEGSTFTLQLPLN